MFVRTLRSLPETRFHHLFLGTDTVSQYTGAGCMPWILMSLVLPETPVEVALPVNHSLEAKGIWSGYRCPHPVWGGVNMSSGSQYDISFTSDSLKCEWWLNYSYSLYCK